ncbi:hypothetical protein M2444_004716 [Paenibacillus sp. PastF-3]|uniref:hypothetical protein n=1 Tax=unclassified Paenibacillus TaxID=185978 RepID=UPI000BA0AD8E|nr:MULTISPECIES: hypothetical protein [unclassified Paenibacillus]MDH6372887.1 hypothetical protein [Paenibacillus sp. PastF-3]OZQ85767.1 hypothetical protein CA598_20095 [Paenibacillus sp. VTT E-133291]
MELSIRTVEEWKDVLLVKEGPEYGKPKNTIDLSARVSVEVWMLISQAKVIHVPEVILLLEIEKVYEAYFYLMPRMRE